MSKESFAKLLKANKGRSLEELVTLPAGAQLTPIEQARLNLAIEKNSDGKKKPSILAKAAFVAVGLTDLATAKVKGGYDKIVEAAEFAEETNKEEKLKDAKKALACLKVDFDAGDIKKDEYEEKVAEVLEVIEDLTS